MSAIWQGLVLFYCSKNAASSSRLRKYPPRGTRFWSADLGPQKDETPTDSNHSLWAEATALGASRAWSPREGCKSISPHLLTWSADGPPGKRFPNSIKVAEKKWKSLSHSLRCFCHLGRGRTCLKKKGGHGGSFPFPGSYKAEAQVSQEITCAFAEGETHTHMEGLPQAEAKLIGQSWWTRALETKQQQIHPADRCCLHQSNEELPRLPVS